MTNLKTNADQLYEQIQLLIKNTKADALLMNSATTDNIFKGGYLLDEIIPFWKKRA